MNEKFKKLTVELSNEFYQHTLKFLLDKMEEKEDTSNIINLALSAHLSSCFTVMNFLASDDKKCKEEVQKFINDLTVYISKLDPIKNIEVI